MKPYNIHIISDSTGETAHNFARACLVQFKDHAPIEYLWPLVRNKKNIDEALKSVSQNPGPVLYTLINSELSAYLESECQKLALPSIDLIGPIIQKLGTYLGEDCYGKPGLQHALDKDYFKRIDAIQFVLSHDDGQLVEDVHEADVILVGVSRVSKTPTCIYLANRGIKALNIPIVKTTILPKKLFDIQAPPIIALTCQARRLVQIRENRFGNDQYGYLSEYTQISSVQSEVSEALQLYRKNGWPVIDVTKSSIEETASEIIKIISNPK